jgi:uncharacterized ubiquitin-like protein YukD
MSVSSGRSKGHSHGSNSLGQSMTSYTSRRSLDMPDWNAVQDEYIKSIRNGRHPVSFKHKGELWYHCDATNKRLARVSKGHSLTNVMNEDQYYDINDDGGDSWSLTGGSSLDGNSVNSNMTSPNSKASSNNASRINTAKSSTTVIGGVKMKREDAELITSLVGNKNSSPASSKQSKLTKNGTKSVEKARALIDFQLNGMNIDVRFSSMCAFGQLIVILNDNNEVLCVDRQNKIRIKNKSQLLKRDKICFKIVDLREMSNPATVKYGEAMWLQAVETPAPGESVDTNFYSSSVVGCKIFQLATIDTQQLNKDWANGENKQREEIFKREEEVDSDEEYDARMAELERIEKEKKEAAEAALRPKSKGRGWGALKKQDIKKTTTIVKKAIVKEKLKKREEEEEGDDDNKEYVGEVCGSAIAVKLAFNELGGLQEEGLRNEVVSKEALNLGLFIPQSAQSLGKADRPVPGTPVYSNQPVFLSQDLYCLANSIGSTYKPWPLRGTDFSSDAHAHNIQTEEGEGHGEKSSVALDQQNHHGKALKHEMQKHGRREKKQKNKDGEFGVLRKVVKRSKEYEYAVDRKCVWRFCHVDNVTDGHQMTTAEMATAKVMSVAKDKLRKSEMRRKGKKTYEGSRWVQQERLDEEIEIPLLSRGAPILKKSRIPGGESFALELRQDASSNLLDKESRVLEVRREKEQVMKDYMERQISNWDPEAESAFPVDVRSMCSQMTFEYSNASTDKNSPPGSILPGSLLSNDDASQESRGSEDEQAKIMLPIGHEQAYVERQRRVMRQKTLGLKRYHFQQYPYFYKSPKKMHVAEKPRVLHPLEEARYNFNKHFAFNAPLLSPGEKVLGLRQAFEGIQNSEYDTKGANSGVDDSVDIIWSATGVRTEVVDPEKEKLEAEKLAQEMRGGRKKVMEDTPVETEAALQRRLMIEAKVKILADEDDKMWQSVQHRRKLDAARAIQQALENSR